MTNRSKEPVPSIFHVSPIQGPYKELTVCGCGALNPIALDPQLNVIGLGTKILINDAQGFITGLGTRASREKPNLAGYADLLKMDPLFMGGFLTGEGPEVINSWAVPIPILNERIFKEVCLNHSNEPLPIADISDRIPFMRSDYGKVWSGTDRTVRFSSSSCKKMQAECKKNGLIKNGKCPVEEICPVNAFTTKGAKLDRKLCFNCGACTSVCQAGCFKMDMGQVEIEGHIVPITLRQSNLALAIKLAKRLKRKIIDGTFIINEKIDDIKF
jgi:putative methanogenesis marker 16 metalloprotein